MSYGHGNGNIEINLGTITDNDVQEILMKEEIEEAQNACQMAFDEWKADWENRKRSMWLFVYHALQLGETIMEAGRIEWPAAAHRTFLPKYASDNEFITEHLINRHFGFGWDLVVSGKQYHLGIEGGKK